MKHDKDIEKALDILKFYGQEESAVKLTALMTDLAERTETLAKKLYETYEDNMKKSFGEDFGRWEELEKKEMDVWLQVAIAAWYRK